MNVTAPAPQTTSTPPGPYLSASLKATTRRHAIRNVSLITGTGVLVACQMPGQTAAPRMDERDVTLTYITDWTGGARGEYVKQGMPKFTAEFPKIKVQVEAAQGGVGNALLTGAAAGTLQDVFFNENDVFQTLARQGDMRDIAPVLKSLKVNPADIISVPSGTSYAGKQYGLPIQLTVITMMINKTLFKTSGVALPDKTTTFPQWAEMLKKVSRPADNIYGFRTDSSPGGWGQWMPFVWGFGGDRWSDDLKKCTLDSPASVEGLQFYTDLMYRSQVATPLDAKGELIPPGINFVAGNVACQIAASPGAGQEQQIAGKFEWDIMYMPLGPRNNKRFVTLNTNANCVSSTAVKRNVFDQAVQLVAWMSASKAGQDLMVETGASTPVYKPVLNSPKYIAGPPTSQKISIDSIPDWKDPQIFIGWIDFRNAIVPALQPAFAGQKPMIDAARDATRAGQLVLDKIPAK